MMPENQEAARISDDLKKIGNNLQSFSIGAIMRGSNHPFVQYSIEYGKQQHRYMCGNYGGNIKFCDQAFPNFRGRPDLVTIEGGMLVVYEFKPDNSRAISEGQRQLENYMPEIAAYYEQFFENGRRGGTWNS